MILCAVALYFPGSTKVLRVLSRSGFAISFEAKWWDNAFHLLFGYYGHVTQWRMTRGLAWWILPWVMPALLWLSFSETHEQRDNTQELPEN